MLWGGEEDTKQYDFLDYSLFVLFFPQLIAGPIVHHSEIMPQFASKWNMVKNYKNIALGLFIFSVGLFKKVVIADTFAVWANAGFDTATILTFFEAWATSLSYTFQLYFDFSGYTDMAIGSALLFNIKLPINFNSPYKALDIQDFWRRWHITLSRFLKDYIYIPLGGNRFGNLRTYSNLMITFLLGGLWHGAGWTFIFWGFLHGIALVIHRIWQSLGFKLWSWLAWLITFNFINIAWIFFRAKDWDSAIKVLSGMFVVNLSNMKLSLDFLDKVSIWIDFPLHNYIRYTSEIRIVNEISLLHIIFFIFIIFIVDNSNTYITKRITFKIMLLGSIIFSYSIMSVLFTSTQIFLYFNF